MPTIYLVVRQDDDGETTLLAFEPEELALAHAKDAAELTGADHVVRPLTLAGSLPEVLVWHSLVVDLELTGAERWRHEEQVVTFRGHPGARTEPGAEWRVVVRGTPSQPPSRVRIEAVGPDRDWCITQARECWAQARVDATYREAVAIEQMFAADTMR